MGVYKKHKLGDKQFTVIDLSTQCGIPIGTARQRLVRWQSGQLDEYKLFHYGNLPTGGNMRNRGNDEWRELNGIR